MSEYQSLNAQTTEGEQDGEKTQLLFRLIQTGLNWMLFFPILLIERFTDYKIPRPLAFLLLAVAAVLGLYDLPYISLAYPVYAAAIDFSNQSLINSTVVLTIVKSAEFLASYVPVLQAMAEILEQIGGYLANGVLALGIQSVFLKLVQEGLVLRYLLGLGFLLLAVPNLAEFGKKLVFGTLILFLTLPPIVYTEAFVYERLRNPIQEDLESSYGQLKQATVDAGWGSIKEGARAVKEGTLEGARAVTEGALEGARAVTEGAASLSGKIGSLISSEDSSGVPAKVAEVTKEDLPAKEAKVTEENVPAQKAEVTEEDVAAKKAEMTEEKSKQPGFLETIKNLAWTIINALMLLFLITIMTCLVAPIVAYLLIFKLLRELFTHDYFEMIPMENREQLPQQDPSQ